MHRYHQTVGRNCVIELAWSVNRSGLVHPADAQRYAEFGKWIREQYGPPPHFNGRYVLLHLVLVATLNTHLACLWSVVP